ncbi:MAG: fasciclin domain-containing protein, partial [Anaerolineales bacterium]
AENTNAPAVVENTAENTAEEPMEEDAMPSIAEIAAGNEDFSTLVTALETAGLVETLAGEGSFTVFAPTNDAFAALGSDLDAVLADNELLTSVLLYHVVDGKVLSPDAIALAGSDVDTLSGDAIALSLQDDSLYINDAMVTAVDIEASNGVIHVIDAVLLPPAEMAEEPGTIVDIAVADERFSTLVTALQQAELVETLAGEGAFTVFAPTNDAFAALGSDLDAVLADNELLTKVLLYHVLDSEVASETAVTLDGQTVETLAGDSFEVSVKDGSLYINDAMVVIADIEASNGVIHVIDAVLLPTG